MRVGIIQSSYIPWRGYFDFIDSIDLFIIFDDIQFGSKGSWRHRNQIKTVSGLKWLTVPVKSKMELPIDQVMIENTGKSWQESHHRMLTEHLGPAPFFTEAIEIWKEGVSANEPSISQLNIRLFKLICDYLCITTPLVMSRSYAATGAKTERLINLLKKVSATVYLSGPSASGYLDENLFRESGISLEYKTYDYEPYPQMWGEFEGAVSVLDLIANTGPEARRFLKSSTPNQVVVP